MTSNLTIRRLNGASDLLSVEWDAFVAAHSEAGPMHWAGWHGILTDAFSVEPIFLAAVDSFNRVFGVAPLYFSTSMFEGPHLATLQDGILAADAEIAGLLLAAVLAESENKRADMVIVRGGLPADATPKGTLPVVHSIIDTARGAADLIASLKQKVRWEIRQCNGLEFVESREPGEVSRFHCIFADHQQRLGTPAQGQKFFPAIFRNLGAHAKLFYVTKSGVMEGGMVVVRSGRGWASLYAAMNEDARDHSGGYFLYWKVLEWMCMNGVPEFDLGRSTPDSGVHRFKGKWGGIDVTKIYGYFGPKGSNSAASMARIRGEQTLKQKIWKTLPAPFCRLLGPLVRRQLPMG